ncbi:levanase/fructan beta-fructosidase/levanbiose-producing levanase [Agromyces sp. CF514]|uniref:glycoside hydrolase family 32 protein n=1 Tax=Agromyces sp. CF514 TaxID=1881031 RepID=UPI0008F0C7A6|nr:glycoside hydrolase family 32 protein [Agromyces sp. CF514]SFR71230.1 levanase/fructan beta-fructosidase/levanbiose-producing levanase [Agromyces sp. CF514]
MQAPNGHVPRPRFHFTPQRNWMNDPNGLVYDRGLWHLYFQYNPEGADWGNMSWGHATSPDLRRWTEHEVALRYREGEQVFSGSVVATASGSEPAGSGAGSGAADGGALLTAFYTSAYDDDHQAQSMATSRDGGYTWQPDPQNPVLDRGTSAFRDPKVIRFTDAAGTTRYVMLTVEADDRQVLFYSSRDLRSWEHVSTFGPLGETGVVWECPDLVPLAVDGDPADIRWVLLLSTNPVGDDPDPDGSSMHYVIGSFDGAVFRSDAADLTRLDHGRDFYAGVTFDSAPGGEAIMLAWMSNWRYAAAIPSSPWRGAMSLPRRMSLRTVAGTVRLVQQPVGFVGELLAGATPSTVFGASEPAEFTLSGHSLLELAWDPAATGAPRLQLRGDADALVEVSHDPSTHVLSVTRSGAATEGVHPDFPSTSTVTLPGSADDPVGLLVSLDGPLLEVFANDGETTVSNLVILGAGPIAAKLTTELPGPVSALVADVPAPEAASRELESDGVKR